MFLIENAMPGHPAHRRVKLHSTSLRLSRDLAGRPVTVLVRWADNGLFGEDS
jgi:hypothetical protein